MRGLLALLLAVLAACGGGAAGPVALVVQQATPAPSAPAVQAPASAAEPAESAPSAAAASWVQVWREDWPSLRLGTWAPCFIRWALADVPAGPRALAIEYTPPPASICWRYYLDAVLVLAERCDDRGAQLDGPPRVGVFAVNLRAEAMHLTSRLRATVGPLSVWQAATP